MANHEGLDGVLRYLAVATRGVFGRPDSAWDSLQAAGGEESVEEFFQQQQAASEPAQPIREQVPVQKAPAAA